VKHNFFKGRTFINIDTLQADCLAWLDRTGNAKVHSTTRKVPKQEWLIEKQHLQPYSGTPERPLVQLPEYKVRKDNTIAYRGNFYSLPIDTYQGVETKVLLADKDNVLSIFTLENELLASHKIPIKKGIYVRNTDHGRTKSKTLRKTHETLLYELGNTHKASIFLSRLEKDKPRYYHDNMRAMVGCVKKASKHSIGLAIDFCLENDVLNGYRFVEVLHYYQKENTLEEEKKTANIPKLNNELNYSDIQPEISNINFYEKII